MDYLASSRFKDYVRRIAPWFCDADRENVMQDIWVAYLTVPPRPDGDGSDVVRWACGVARHAVIKHSGHRSRLRSLDEVALGQIDSHRQAFGAVLDWKDKGELLVRQMVSRLGIKGEALRMWIDECSYKEIGAKLGKSEGAVTMMLHHGREAFRKDPGMQRVHEAKSGPTYGAHAVVLDTEIVAADGNSTNCSLQSTPLLWGSDGFVTAGIEMPRDWPTHALVALLVRAATPEDSLASSVQQLTVHEGVAKLDVYLDEPPPELVLRGPVNLPVSRLTLLLAN